MILINKKRGETPLQALERARKNKNSLKKEKLSYIGRLDPMAEGAMILIAGEENNNREKYLNFDKEYEATFLLGVSTDSGDILGLINGVSVKYPPDISIKRAINGLYKIKSQKYPWMSGKTIDGKKMFDIYKDGEADKFKRPTLKVRIHKISNIKFSSIDMKKLEKDILITTNKVNGEFRQKDIVKKWREFFADKKVKKIKIFSFKVKVSSGTFIRGFCENFEKSLKVPVLLYRLKRTKIFHN